MWRAVEPRALRLFTFAPLYSNTGMMFSFILGCFFYECRSTKVCFFNTNDEGDFQRKGKCFSLGGRILSSLFLPCVWFLQKLLQQAFLKYIFYWDVYSHLWTHLPLFLFSVLLSVSASFWQFCFNWVISFFWTLSGVKGP